MKKSFFNKKILGNFVFINEENKSKEIQGKNVLSFTKFVLGGFCPGVLSGELLSGGLCPWGFCPGVFVLIPFEILADIFISLESI